MLLSPLDLLYITLAVGAISLTIPLTMILWRVYGFMDRVEKILIFAERMVGYAQELESIPMKIIEKVMGK